MMLTCLDMFLERFETALERLLPVINHMIIDLKLLYYTTLQQVQPDLQGNVVSCYTPQYISNIFRWFVCFHLTKSILLSAFTTFKLVAQTSTDIPQKNQHIYSAWASLYIFKISAEICMNAYEDPTTLY